MPIEKNMTIDDLPEGDVAIEMEDELPSDIDIEFDAETGAVVINIGAEDDDVAYDSNLAEVIEPDVLHTCYGSGCLTGFIVRPSSGVGYCIGCLALAL